ncbi:uncharacterized protein [Procambarus clarkii]|uniref:uncharacterized protein isoform X1 n=1 Tax=Procambarus clarkii TaxID=6728 RepID=UPI0037426D03
MSARVKLAGSDSFLNRLLVMREQEVLNLSKKLHHQVALDSDGGSGASEGSLGSPERNSISSPPPTSPHPRLHSPTSDANQEFLPAADLKPEFLPDGTRLHYRNCRSEDRYDDHHYDHPDPLHHQHLQHNSDYRHHEHSKGQVDQSHRPYEAEKHDDRLPFIRGSYDHNDDNSWGSYDTQSDRYQEVEEEEEEQQQDGGPEEGNEGSKMEMSILHERLQHQQQMALAARALLGTLTSPAQQPSLLSFPHQLHPEKMSGSTNLMVRALASTAPRRPRGEKKPIPDTLKDDKYYERRKRNNLAAKKSRDARKQREDQVAIRASILEKENAILRAQVATLRDEAASLRDLLLQKRTKRQ